MNLFIFTCRIVNGPIVSHDHKQIAIKMIVSLCNNKKGIPSYNIPVKAVGRIGRTIFDLYKKTDFVIIQGSLKIHLKKVYINRNYFKTIKVISIRVKKIYPTNHIFKLCI